LTTDLADFDLVPLEVQAERQVLVLLMTSTSGPATIDVEKQMDDSDPLARPPRQQCSGQGQTLPMPPRGFSERSS
jgi:hypothetical protein